MLSLDNLSHCFGGYVRNTTEPVCEEHQLRRSARTVVLKTDICPGFPRSAPGNLSFISRRRHFHRNARASSDGKGVWRLAGSGEGREHAQWQLMLLNRTSFPVVLMPAVVNRAERSKSGFIVSNATYGGA